LNFPNELKKIIQVFKKLPGVGSKTAERFAFHLLEWEDSEISLFAESLKEFSLKIECCESCGCIKNQEACQLCNNNKRDTQILCIVSNSKDVFSIEQTSTYRGLYHVLNNLLSPFEGKTVETTELEKIKKRVIGNNIQEILIAIDSTIEGDATALFLKQHLEPTCKKISRLAFGVPLNSSLEYIDEGTLARALINRQSF